MNYNRIFCVFNYRQKPIITTGYKGPFLEVIDMWYICIRIVINKMTVLQLRVGDENLIFDKDHITTLSESIQDLPDDLSAWMYDTFETPLLLYEEKNPKGDMNSYIQQVRDSIKELATSFLQHEIQAIWACFYNDKNFMPLDVFCNHEDVPFPLNEVLERWTPLKMATIYYVGILSTKYSELHFTPEKVLSLFVSSNLSEPNEYSTFDGSLLPSFDFITTLAIKHRANVSSNEYIINTFI